MTSPNSGQSGLNPNIGLPAKPIIESQPIVRPQIKAPYPDNSKVERDLREPVEQVLMDSLNMMAMLGRSQVFMQAPAKKPPEV